MEPASAGLRRRFDQLQQVVAVTSGRLQARCFRMVILDDPATTLHEAHAEFCHHIVPSCAR